MNLKTIFKKPVDRHIEGVIKADDEASIRLEIEEYVLTNEIEKRMESFLDAYKNYEGANGVWVSGFFGSGKSHLLKMLALLLEDRKVDGKSALEIFLPKCKDNEILRGDLKYAASIPSQSILFNIDQKADVISKTQIDALLSVFIKVFDESCGYYGKQPYIAQFERELDRDGLFQKFKDAFLEVSSKDWEWGRIRSKRVATHIDSAYQIITGQDVSGILDKYRSDYRLSIEDFAEQVNDYIENQEKGFRLNFFVDEVGQYIADNIKLMTNLQTIAESLATKCRGRSWVIVTAQEDLNTVIGEEGKQQSNDFSKIQARFYTRMKLTSADVAEVIQKRLLLKNNDGISLLSSVYHEQSNNFKTLFDFADGSQTYRNFQDRDHFIHSYPFIPYQFVLFQSAIQNLSIHNAFEGKHSSVGERSMLGVFQQVAIHVGDQSLGTLATFDLMFEGIRTALKSNIQRSIIVAEKQLDNRFAIRLLKALFLVKYIKEFKPTLRNLSILMLDSFNQDLSVLHKTIEEALNLLEQKTYIQRNGEIYEYLTEEEKDVENDIKATEVETTKIAEEIDKIIFDHIIKNRKIRYDENGQDYSYSRKLDDRLYGREQELAIHVITPFNENSGDELVLQMQNMGRDEFLIVMPPDDRFARDILLYLQTAKYIKQNISITQKETVKRILTDKSLQNSERYADLQDYVKNLLKAASFFIAGNKIEIQGEDSQTRIIRGFHELISRTYPNLRMLRSISYTENDISKCLKKSEKELFSNDNTTLPEAEQEILAYIQSNNRNGIRSTIKSLLDKFNRKPYGWYYAAILCHLSNLCARGKVEILSDSNILEDEELERTLRNTHSHANTYISPQIDFTASQIRALKDFYEDFFETPAPVAEAKKLSKDTGIALQQLIDNLNLFLAQSNQYSFLSILKPVIDTLTEYSGKSYQWYLTELQKNEDILMDLKDDVIEPIQKFMNGPQKEIYDSAKKFIQEQESNFSYLEGDEANKLRTAITDPNCFKGKSMQNIKSLMDTLQKKITLTIDNEIVKAKNKVDAIQKRLCGMSEFNLLNSEQQKEIENSFQQFINSIEAQKLLAVIRDRLRYFEESEYPKLLTQLSNKVTPAYEQQESKEREINSASIAPELVSVKTLKVPFTAAWLANENDVDQYLSDMRKAMLDQINDGKRIQI